MDRVAKERTIREVVVDDYRTASVFQKHGLDFCCGGGATIERACEKKGIDVEALLVEITGAMETPSSGEARVNSWELDMLVDYIVNNHHAYIRSVLPALRQHAEKVARVHGPARQSLVEIAETFQRLSEDLEAHMQKEEQILFPYIKEMVRAKRNGVEAPPSPFGSARNPIRMMEMEHQRAGDEMEQIRTLSDNYTPPSDACMTYRVLFQDLADFEQDLHRHVHLENNILFPKAVELESEMSAPEVV